MSAEAGADLKIARIRNFPIFPIFWAAQGILRGPDFRAWAKNAREPERRVYLAPEWPEKHFYPVRTDFRRFWEKFLGISKTAPPKALVAGLRVFIDIMIINELEIL